MVRLIIIVEGETEEEFVNEVLRPYFEKHFNYWGIACYKIKATKGGLTKYKYLQKDIRHTINEGQSYVTTLIDFYGLPSDMPNYENAHKLGSSDFIIEHLEQAMSDDIQAANFLPYIQKHEFEALLFCGANAFDEYEEDARVAQQVNKIAQQFGDRPEDINNSKLTAPSKRLIKIYQESTPRRNYDKVTMGVIITETIGLPAIRQKCPRFNTWLQRLEAIIQRP